MRPWLKAVLIVLGVLAFSVAVWFGGPFAGYGDVYPFESAFWRIFVIAALVALVGGIYGYRYWRRRKAEKALADGVGAGSCSDAGLLLYERLHSGPTTGAVPSPTPRPTGTAAGPPARRLLLDGCGTPWAAAAGMSLGRVQIELLDAGQRTYKVTGFAAC